MPDKISFKQSLLRSPDHQAKFAGETVKILSSSMLPLLKAGDHVYFEKKSIRVGEVALFLSQGKFLAHRIVACWQTRVGTLYAHKGDASKTCGLCKEHEVVGVATSLARVSPKAFFALRLWFIGHFIRAYAEWKTRFPIQLKNTSPLIKALKRLYIFASR